jgi:hypothetical protein
VALNGQMMHFSMEKGMKVFSNGQVFCTQLNHISREEGRVC